MGTRVREFETHPSVFCFLFVIKAGVFWFFALALYLVYIIVYIYPFLLFVC